MSADLATTLRDHWSRLKLVSVEIRESVGGQQAIVKYSDRIFGPWGVGCDEDPATALEKALIAGAEICAETPTRLGAMKEWTAPAADQFDDLLG